MNVLVIGELLETSVGLVLNPATRHAVTAGLLCGAVDLLIIGAGLAVAGEQAARIDGVQRVLAMDDGDFTRPSPELLAPLLAQQAVEYSHIIMTATAFGKNLLPRLAALLDFQPVSDVIAIEAADIFQRPIYAGNAIATVQSTDKIKLLTVRATAFAAASDGGPDKIVVNIAKLITAPGRSSRFVGQEMTVSTRPVLTAARVVVSGGRGLGSRENFAMLEPIADYLGAAIGASRAAVDAGFVPNDYQVGQTGKVVAPELYIAVGISGAIQHLAGMKGSRVIVAINKDVDAPIFQIADYGLVGDLFEIIPELARELAQEETR